MAGENGNGYDGNYIGDFDMPEMENDYAPACCGRGLEDSCRCGLAEKKKYIEHELRESKIMHATNERITRDLKNLRAELEAMAAASSLETERLRGVIEGLQTAIAIMVTKMVDAKIEVSNETTENNNKQK